MNLCVYEYVCSYVYRISIAPRSVYYSSNIHNNNNIVWPAISGYFLMLHGISKSDKICLFHVCSWFCPNQPQHHKQHILWVLVSILLQCLRYPGPHKNSLDQCNAPYLHKNPTWTRRDTTSKFESCIIWQIAQTKTIKEKHYLNNECSVLYFIFYSAL